MKKMTVLFYLGIVCLFHSCTLDIDFDDKDSRGYLAVIANGNNTDGSVSEDGFLDLEISGEDKDGIESIQIEIPALNIDFFIQNGSDGEYWKITQTFNLTEIDKNRPTVIYVTLVDKNGNSYGRTVRFTLVTSA